MVRFHAKQGALSFDGTPFSRGSIQVECEETAVASDRLGWRPAPGGFKAAADGIELLLRLGRGGVSVTVRNRRRTDLTLKAIHIRFDPASQPAPLETVDWLEFIHSFHFGQLSGVKRVGLANSRMEPNPESSMVYALRRRNAAETVVFSSLPPHRGDFIRFKALHDAPHLEGRFGLLITSVQDRVLKPGAAAETSTIQALTGTEPLVLLEKVGAQWAKARKLPLKPVKTGWNSWDYYAGAVTAKNMRDNQACATRKLGGRVDYFVIDEGWEPRWGAWTANWKFPAGTRGFCREVKAKGGKPGIWTAPLLVNTYLELFRDHPDWFLRDRAGQIAQRAYSYGPMAFLDITHPAVEKWLFATFARLRKDGFAYFKVDFTQEILAADRWHDRTVPRGELLRRAFAVIRRAIGNDAYLLACGAPFETVAGIVDAARVTGDIHHFWSHVLANAGSIAARWWTHRQLWNIDPDFFIVRSRETCTLDRLFRPYTVQPMKTGTGGCWMSGREMNLREIMTYALLIHVSAGDRILSDELMTLNKTGLAIIRKVMEHPLTRAAAPLDLFGRHNALPRFWLARETDGWFLGVFNWEEDTAAVRVDLPGMGIPAESKIRAFWTGKTIPASDGVFVIELQPRASEGFQIALE